MKKYPADYDDALARLQANCPIRVPKGSKINNDNVSLEAGRQKGSIKASRSTFNDLIKAIADAEKAQEKNRPNERNEVEELKAEVKHFREAMEDGLQREISLVRELYAVKKLNAQLTGSNVISIRGDSENAKKNGQSS